MLKAHDVRFAPIRACGLKQTTERYLGTQLSSFRAHTGVWIETLLSFWKRCRRSRSFRAHTGAWIETALHLKWMPNAQAARLDYDPADVDRIEELLIELRAAKASNEPARVAQAYAKLNELVFGPLTNAQD